MSRAESRNWRWRRRKAKPPHVRDIEHADRISGRVVFFGDRRVLHRHRPAGEIDHPAAVCDVPIVERRAELIRWSSSSVVGSPRRGRVGKLSKGHCILVACGTNCQWGWCIRLTDRLSRGIQRNTGTRARKNVRYLGNGQIQNVDFTESIHAPSHIALFSVCLSRCSCAIFAAERKLAAVARAAGHGRGGGGRLPGQVFQHEGVAWKVELPGVGTSTPAVWGDRIFVTCAHRRRRTVSCAST